VWREAGSQDRRGLSAAAGHVKLHRAPFGRASSDRDSAVRVEVVPEQRVGVKAERVESVVDDGQRHTAIVPSKLNVGERVAVSPRARRLRGIDTAN
jgi:hypothetical protein